TSMSVTPSRKPSSSQRRKKTKHQTSINESFGVCRRRSVGTSGRHALSDASSTHTYPCRHTACSDNHGIRPPSAEQYLTPLQQKEVCIRHLRARLRENVERLHHRDYEIEELRTQLYKMQEDWIEEECHRVEAQLALKEARKEIQHLQEVVESVQSNLGIREKDQHDQKPYLGLQGARPGGRSRSCECSPASTLSRSATCTRQSSEALQLERSSNAPEPAGASRPAGQTRLLLEAALLPDQLPPQACDVGGPSVVPCSSSHERMCSGGVRSQACSPTMTWLQEESGTDELSVISLPPADSPPSFTTLPVAPPPEHSTQRLPAEVQAQPHTSQPQPVGQGAPIPGTDENVGAPGGANEDEPPPPLCHWSRYFLVDLMALTMPVVPTVAWLCRGAPQEVLPVYHIGSLLRGCCAVALHSLRQQGAGRGLQRRNLVV
uniref:Syntaphilin a n=1 Tax=Oryzias sinensis TaxID=183150 RepID=A0A8C7ZAK1_9TELE